MHPFYTLTSAYDAQRQQIKRRKNVDDPLSVLGVDTGDGGLSCYTLHNDYFHSNFTYSTEQITGAAGYFKIFSFTDTCEHVHPHSLLSHSGAVFFQIVLENFRYFCFFKGLSCADNQLCFIYLIQKINKNSKYNNDQS